MQLGPQLLHLLNRPLLALLAIFLCPGLRVAGEELPPLEKKKNSRIWTKSSFIVSRKRECKLLRRQDFNAHLHPLKLLPPSARKAGTVLLQSLPFCPF